MKLKSLSAFETLNTETVSFINGGSSSDSRRWDSTSQDSKKRDRFKDKDKDGDA